MFTCLKVGLQWDVFVTGESSDANTFSGEELDWKNVLNEIIKILDNDLKELLVAFPAFKKQNLTKKFKNVLPNKIILTYGKETSFDIMKKVTTENFQLDKIKELLSGFEDKYRRNKNVETTQWDLVCVRFLQRATLIQMPDASNRNLYLSEVGSPVSLNKRICHVL